MKKTNVCMHRIITTKPSYPWNSEKASTFWFPKFLTVTFIHHPKHTAPKNWNPIQKTIILRACFQIMSFQIRKKIWCGKSQAFPNSSSESIHLGVFRVIFLILVESHLMHFACKSSSKAQYWRRSSNPLASSSREGHSWDHSIDHTGLPLSQGQTMGKGSNHGKTHCFLVKN